MNYLLSLDNGTRMAITFGLFLASFAGFLITASLWFGLLMIIAIGLIIFTNIKASDQRINALNKQLPSVLSKINFKSDDSYLADNFLTALAINRSREEIAILQRNRETDEFAIKIFSFKHIIESSVREDNITVTKSSKGSVIGGAMVGGVLAGGVGAVVGGLSGEKTSTDKVYNMNLSITVDDLHNPHYEINFMNVPQGVSKSSPVYQNIRTEIDKWHKTFSVIMNRNEKMNNLS